MFRVCLAAAVLLIWAAPVAAQLPTPTPTPTPTPVAIQPLKPAPIPLVAVDLRVGFASLGQDVVTAASLQQVAADLPNRVRTLVAGAHLYLLREGSFKLGVGAEAVRGVGSNQRLDSSGNETGPIIRRRLEGVTGQLSLNFGKGKGWSYLTVGGGPMKFESYLDDAKPTRAAETVLNYGGGARWTFKSHLAFVLDLRMYLTRPAVATIDSPARARKRITLLSAGISIK